MPPTLSTDRASDTTLMERMGTGDEQALGTLYDRHARMVFSVAHAILGRAQDAEEVTEDVFVQIWSDPERFDSDRGSLKSYMATIARSRALDRVRAGSRRYAAYERAAATEKEGTGVGVSASEPADRGAEESEMRNSVGNALSTLNEGQRQAIELAYLRGFSQSEIAEELGEPLGTIKTRIRDGMAKLRKLLAHSPEAFG